MDMIGDVGLFFENLVCIRICTRGFFYSYNKKNHLERWFFDQRNSAIRREIRWLLQDPSGHRLLQR